MTAYFRQLDLCISDYFRGYSGRVFAVPVDCSTTYAEIIEALERDYFDSDPALDGFSLSDFDEAMAAIKLEFADRLSVAAFPKLEPYSDDCESVYLYLTVISDEAESPVW